MSRLDDGPVMTLTTAARGDTFIVLSMLIKWDHPCTNHPLEVSLIHTCSKNKGISFINNTFLYDLESDAGGKVILVTDLLCSATCPYTVTIGNGGTQYYRAIGTFLTLPCPGRNVLTSFVHSQTFSGHQTLCPSLVNIKQREFKPLLWKTKRLK